MAKKKIFTNLTDELDAALKIECIERGGVPRNILIEQAVYEMLKKSKHDHVRARAKAYLAVAPEYVYMSDVRCGS